MSRVILSGHQKALTINLDKARYGTFAEIGAAQEVARSFFRVGGAAGTVAKSMSAYDMKFSDSIYGPCDRYVSFQRLRQMLDHEWDLLIERLGGVRGDSTTFFVFADTVRAKSFSGSGECHGWLGVQFQLTPHGQPNVIALHVRMWDRETVQQHEALGMVGVNLIYGAFYLHEEPEELIGSLIDELTTDRVEVDRVEFSGPDFEHIDNRIMALHLLSLNLTQAVMFAPGGAVLQPSEALYKTSILLERGYFRPVTRINVEMMESARTHFRQTSPDAEERVLEIMEISTNNLLREGRVDYADFIARVEVLGALGLTVMVSSFAEFYRLGTYLSRFTTRRIGIVLGVPLLKEVFNEKYYADLEGGILESFGRLFKYEIKLLAVPSWDAATGQALTVERVELPSRVHHLFRHLVENGLIVPLPAMERQDAFFSSRDVVDKMLKSDPTWEEWVMPQVADMIKSRGLFGYPREMARAADT